MIVGQLGGGLGDASQRTTKPSPYHESQGATWPIANGPGAINNPPPQGPRVQSFSTEVAGGASTSLTWTAPRPGTYLIESGTHPSIQGPMGLYGILVVTTAPSGNNAGTAYTGVSYNADVPLLFSEIDPATEQSGRHGGRPAISMRLPLGPYARAAHRHFQGGEWRSRVIRQLLSVSFGGGGNNGATATAVIDTDPTSPTYGQVTEIDVVTVVRDTRRRQRWVSGEVAALTPAAEAALPVDRVPPAAKAPRPAIRRR